MLCKQEKNIQKQKNEFVKFVYFCVSRHLHFVVVYPNVSISPSAVLERFETVPRSAFSPAAEDYVVLSSETSDTTMEKQLRTCVLGEVILFHNKRMCHKWHPIPCSVSSLLQAYGPWSKVIHYIGNRVQFLTHYVFIYQNH